MLFDTHCHIAYTAYDADRAEVITRARDAGVSGFLVIGAGEGIDGAQAAIQLAQAHDDMWATAGVHPHDADTVTEDTYKAIRDLTAHDVVAAVGEMGLDYHYDNSPRDTQRRVFAKQLALARDVDLPVVIHSRDAAADTYAILRDVFEERASDKVYKNLNGVMHCYTGDVDWGEKFAALGFLLSIPGIVTFKNAETMRDVVRHFPLERFVIETDCPYLAPVPHRGKRNEPAFIGRTADAIAALHGITRDDVARTTTLQARRLLRLPIEHQPEIVYRIRDSLYLNITNACTLHCTFCPKFTTMTVKGHYLDLNESEPSVEDIMAAIDTFDNYTEVVFVGFGESTLRLDTLIAVGHTLKARGVRVRLDTDGLGNLVHGRNIVPDLAPVLDAVSVSLNAQDAATYAKYCRSEYGEAAYPAIKEFIREAKKAIPEVIASVVTVPEVDVEECRRIAEDELGVAFRARAYNNVG